MDKIGRISYGSKSSNLNKNPTIIHLITTLGGGGAEKIVLDLSKKSKENNDRVIVISVTSIKTLEPEFIKNEIPCYFLDIDSPKTFVSGLIKVKQILKGLKNKVFHCHMFHALIVAYLYNLSRNPTPIVFTIHSNMVEEFYRRIIYYLTKPLRQYDIIFTENSKKWFLKNNAVIPNGINLQDFKFSRKYDSKQKIINFLFLGRLNKEKNPLVLVEMARVLYINGYKNFKICVVGDGYLKNQLEDLITMKEMNSFFKLYGFRTDISDIIKNMDCMLITSHWEGMPISLLEAGASALPIISTKVGTIPDVLDNQRGYIASIEEFPKIMKNLIVNYKDAFRRGKLLQNYILENYDINKVYKKNKGLYNSVTHST